jgi:hypothetical protein
MKAGVHSMNHPQFSIFKAQFLYPLQIKNLKKSMNDPLAMFR